MNRTTNLTWILTSEEVPYDGQYVLFTCDGTYFHYGVYSEERGRKAFYTSCEPDIENIVNDVWAWAYVDYPENMLKWR